MLHNTRIGALISKTRGLVVPLSFVERPESPNVFFFEKVMIFEKDKDLRNMLKGFFLGKAFNVEGEIGTRTSEIAPVLIPQKHADRPANGIVFEFDEIPAFSLPVVINIEGRNFTHKMSINDVDRVIIFDDEQPNLCGQVSFESRISAPKDENFYGVEAISEFFSSRIQELEDVRKTFLESAENANFSRPDNVQYSVRVQGNGIILQGKGESKRAGVTELRRLVSTGIMKNLTRGSREQYIQHELDALEEKKKRLLEQLSE